MKLDELPADEVARATAPVQADIGFAVRPDGATAISRQRVGYPFHLGRALSLPGDPVGMASVYLQGCSGGIFAGDDLGVRAVAGPGAQAHLTTAAATIAHSMDAAPAALHVELCAEADAHFEFMPEATILFPGSRLRSVVDVTLDPSARVLLTDALVMHDPQGSDRGFDWYESDTRVHDATGRLLLRDRFRVTGEEMARHRPGVNGPCEAQASIFLLAPQADSRRFVALMRAAVDGRPGLYAGASQLPNGAGAWARLLAADAVAIRPAVHALWAAIREELTGVRPAPRRK